MKRIFLVILGVLIMGSGSVYAGENAAATVSLDLETEGGGIGGNQGNLTVQNVGPKETVILSIYGNALSNVYSYVLELKFDTTKVIYVEGGATNTSFAEFDVFLAAALNGNLLIAPDPEDPSIIAAASAVLSDPKPTADKAPDGDGKLLAWMKFTTRASMSPSDEVGFSVVKAQFRGVDEVWDEVPSEKLPTAFLNVSDAVEQTHWGQIKASFR